MASNLHNAAIWHSVTDIDVTSNGTDTGNTDQNGIMLHTKTNSGTDDSNTELPLKCIDKHALSFSREFVKSGYLDMEDDFFQKCYKKRRMSRLKHELNEMSNDILHCGEFCIDEYILCIEEKCLFGGTIGYKLHTLLSWHNETINIYTHLIPAIIVSISLFLQLFETYTVENYSSTHTIRQYIINTFVISMISCFLLSSYYHMQCCVYPSLHQEYLKIDMLGIWCLVVGSFVAGFYVIFECHPFWQQLYLSLFLGCLTLVMIPLWFIWPNKTSYVSITLTLCAVYVLFCCACFFCVLIVAVLVQCCAHA